MTSKRSITATQAPAPRQDDSERLERRPVHRPRTDIIETETSVLLRADMPGIEEKDLEITVEKNTLRIRGAANEPETGSKDVAFREFGPADYERAFILSNEVDRDKIQARLKNGVLELTLPKGVYAQTKKIPISTG